MNRLALKILHSPRTIAALMLDRLIGPAWLRMQGVEYGSGLSLVGLPEIRMSQNGHIRLGSNVSLYSRRQSNPMQLHTPCVFRLLQSNACINIGDHSALSGVVICAVTGVEIGQHVLIGANCKIVDTDFHPLLPEDRLADHNLGASTRPIIIENNVFIGAHAIILKGTVLRECCVVGAGAIVSGTFPAYSIIAGNPARIIRDVRETAA